MINSGLLSTIMPFLGCKTKNKAPPKKGTMYLP